MFRTRGVSQKEKSTIDPSGVLSERPYSRKNGNRRQTQPCELTLMTHDARFGP